MANLSVFQTLGVLGAALRLESPSDSSICAAFLKGTFDNELRELGRYKFAKMSEDEINKFVERTKDHLRANMEKALAKATAELRQTKIENAILESKIHQHPHHLGTVDEIAKRYGISKSQVRRLKAEAGTALEDYLNTLTPVQKS